MAQAQDKISLEPGLAQLHSFPGQIAPTSGPGASARRGYSARNRLLQTRRSSAAEKRGAKALRGIRVRNAARSRLCPGEEGTAGGASAPGVPRLTASEDTGPQRSGEVHLYSYQACRHAHPHSRNKDGPEPHTPMRPAPDSYTRHGAGKEPHEPTTRPVRSSTCKLSVLAPQAQSTPPRRSFGGRRRAHA